MNRSMKKSNGKVNKTPNNGFGKEGNLKHRLWVTLLFIYDFVYSPK
jgi:hypothetical protein